MSSASLARTDRVATNRLLWVGPLSGVVAAVANVIVFVICQSLLSIPFMVPMGSPDAPPTPLPIFAVVMASIIPALGATVLYALLGRFTSRPTLIFLIIAVVFLVVSFWGPLGLPIDGATQLALNAMHVVAGVAIAGMLVTLGRQRG